MRRNADLWIRADDDGADKFEGALVVGAGVFSAVSSAALAASGDVGLEVAATAAGAGSVVLAAGIVGDERRRCSRSVRRYARMTLTAPVIAAISWMVLALRLPNPFLCVLDDGTHTGVFIRDRRDSKCRSKPQRYFIRPAPPADGCRSHLSHTTADQRAPFAALRLPTLIRSAVSH